VFKVHEVERTLDYRGRTNLVRVGLPSRLQPMWIRLDLGSRGSNHRKKIG